jgi:hypothetical protein
MMRNLFLPFQLTRSTDSSQCDSVLIVVSKLFLSYYWEVGAQRNTAKVLSTHARQVEYLVYLKQVSSF